MSVHECTCGHCYLTEAKQLHCEVTHNIAELESARGLLRRVVENDAWLPVEEATGSVMADIATEKHKAILADARAWLETEKG